jgi:hypothetical protein
MPDESVGLAFKVGLGRMTASAFSSPGKRYHRPADGMYSWTWEILQSQILAIRRAARSNERLPELSRAKATPKSRPHRPR